MILLLLGLVPACTPEPRPVPAVPAPAVEVSEPDAEAWRPEELTGAWRTVPVHDAQMPAPERGDPVWKHVRHEGSVLLQEKKVWVSSRRQGLQQSGVWEIDGVHARLLEGGAVRVHLERLGPGLALLHEGPHVPEDAPPIPIYRCAESTDADPSCVHSRRELAARLAESTAERLRGCIKLHPLPAEPALVDAPEPPRLEAVFDPNQYADLRLVSTAWSMSAGIRQHGFHVADDAQPEHDLQEHASGAQGYPDGAPSHDAVAWEAWRVGVLDAVRAHLVEPDRLRATWERFEPVARERIASSKNPRVIEMVQSAAAAFQSLPAEVVALHEEEAALDRLRKTEVPCAEGSWDRTRAIRDEIEALGFDPYLVGFVQRRRAEGGQPLVDAWAEILRDLASSQADAPGE